MAFYNEFPGTRNYDGDLLWLIRQIHGLLDSFAQMGSEFDELKNDQAALKDYVDNYFSTLDLSAEVTEILEAWKDDGTLYGMILSAYGYHPTYELNKLITQDDTIRPATIGFLGDSITYGYPFGGEEGEQSPTNYPARIKALLDDQGYPADVHNYGISGAASSMWRSQYNQAKADNCGIVCFMFGHNNFRLDMGLGSIMRDVIDFILQARADGITPFVSSQNPYLGTQANRSALTAELAAQLKSVCEMYGAIYIPVFERISELEGCGLLNSIQLSGDGVHFVNYRPIADIVAAYMLPFLFATPGRFLQAWRNTGSEWTGSVGQLPLITRANARCCNLTSNSTFVMRWYSDKPFKLATITGDMAGSGSVTWTLEGPPGGDWLSSPLSASGVATDVHDYYKSVSAPGDITQLTRYDLFDGRVLPPGAYKLSLTNMDRGAAPAVYSVRLYLFGLLIDPVDYSFTYL